MIGEGFGKFSDEKMAEARATFGRSYTIVNEVTDRRIVRHIVCLFCGASSSLPGDVEHRYCARCHLHHDAVMEAWRLMPGGTHDCSEWRTARGRCALCDFLLS